MAFIRGGASQYATVQKLLERLEDKGYVRRDRGATSTSSSRLSAAMTDRPAVQSIAEKTL